MPKPSRLILASGSPRRKALLAATGVDFEVQVAEVEEVSETEETPESMVLHNASIKAAWVAERNPCRLVLGADTTVFLDGKALNKPKDLADARRMLGELSGREHWVLTGVVLRRTGENPVNRESCVKSSVKFKELNEGLIEKYLALVNTLDKAGAYAVQEHGELIVEKVTGSLTNVVGLPMECVREMLREQGIESWEVKE